MQNFTNQSKTLKNIEKGVFASHTFIYEDHQESLSSMPESSFFLGVMLVGCFFG